MRKTAARPLPVTGLLPGEIAGELVVLAGPVTIRRDGAEVVLAEGDPVGELDDDSRDHLLRTRSIGRRNGAPYVHAARSTTPA